MEMLSCPLLQNLDFQPEFEKLPAVAPQHAGQFPEIVNAAARRST